MNLINKTVRLNPESEVSKDLPSSLIFGKVRNIVETVGKFHIEFTNGYFNWYHFEDIIIEESFPEEILCITDQYLYE
jgi:hypothetical protein